METVWLISAGAVSLVAGLFMLLSGEVVHKLDDFFSVPMAYIDNIISSVRIPAGIILVIIGGWIISVAFSYPMLWYFHVFGAVIIFFGLLYLFLPHWLVQLSMVADRLLFSTDEVVLDSRRAMGMVLIAISLYIFYSVFRIK